LTQQVLFVRLKENSDKKGGIGLNPLLEITALARALYLLETGLTLDQHSWERARIKARMADMLLEDPSLREFATLDKQEEVRVAANWYAWLAEQALLAQDDEKAA